jgi:SAM-dependent methyltransferase
MPIDRERHRARLLRFTRQAFALLPREERRRVLDLGCGCGGPTVELALLSRGEVFALDRDLTALRTLLGRAAADGVGARLRVVRGDLSAVPFQSGSFDLLWAEGSIDAVGFAEGLRCWRRLLRPGGWLVVHDSAADLDRKLAEAARHGFHLTGSVEVPGQAWWADYYVPLLAEASAEAVGGTPAGVAELRSIRREAGSAESAPERMRSVFLVMRWAD